MPDPRTIATSSPRASNSSPRSLQQIISPIRSQAELVALPQRLDGAGLVAGRGGRSPAATRSRPGPTSPGTATQLAGGRGARADAGSLVDGVALRTDAVQHGEDERRFVGVGGGDLDPGIDELGRGGPVVGVLGEEEGLAEEARRPQLGRRARCCLAASLEPDATPRSLPWDHQKRLRFAASASTASGSIVSRRSSARRVVLDAPEHLEVRSFGASLRGFGLTQPDLQVEAGVTIADHVELTGQGELFRGVLTDGLEQLVQAGVGVSQEQRLLDQAGGQVPRSSLRYRHRSRRSR